MKIIVAIFLILFVQFSTLAQVGPLIWEENFHTRKLDTTKWNIETGTGVNGDWGTGQLDRATKRRSNIRMKKKVPGADSLCLMITTREEEYEDRKYTSGRINTKGKASWGPGHRIVARIYARDVKHKGQGFAFWMMPDEKPEGEKHLMWPQGGEVDIMEYVGSIPYHNLGTVHYARSWANNKWKSSNHQHQGAYYSFENQEVPDPSEPGYGRYPPKKNDSLTGSAGFHLYGIDWYTDRIEFFVDSTVYHIHYFNDGGFFSKDKANDFEVQEQKGKRVAITEFSNHFPEWHPFEHKMYLILSAGVGGSNTTYGGAIVPQAKFPCSVFVDWVRVYQLNTNEGK